jgi:CHASE3 domain sensor protein
VKPLFEKKLLTFSVSAITVLLVLNIFLTHHNNVIIDHNRNLPMQAEYVKVTVTQFAIVLIHNLDLGLRSYALYGKKKYLNPMKFAMNYRDSIMGEAEQVLLQQEYPMEEFYQLKDSIMPTKDCACDYWICTRQTIRQSLTGCPIRTEGICYGCNMNDYLKT